MGPTLPYLGGDLQVARELVSKNAYDPPVPLRAALAGRSELKVLDVLRFESGRDHESGVVESDSAGPGVIDVQAVDFFELAVGCDLVKLDIEGGEWPLLRDARLSSLDAAGVILEWHGPAGTGEDAERLLKAAGFEVQLDAPFAPGVGALWAWRG